MTSPTEQRRAFDAALDSYRAGDVPRALATFRQITDQSPVMSDAWLGRLACGDHEVETLASAHAHSRALYRETRRIGLNDGELYAQVKAPLYLTLPVWSRATIALAYASRLITEHRYDDAADVLDDDVVRTDSQAAQWHQFLTAALFHQTRRWHDVRAHTAVSPPAHTTYVLDAVTDATAALSAAATASLGQFQAAVDIAERISTANPYVAADAALTKGWCLRELGEEDAARAAFAAATVDGRLLDAARQALDNPSYRLIVTDADTIGTRTNKWDPSTETSREQRAAVTLAEEQHGVLERAQARLDELIGLDGPKEQIAVWRTEIQIDQLLAAQGEETSSTNENHMVLEGPPGTAKTSFARIVAEILFGLGKIQRPDVVEVTEEDLVVGYVSQTAQRMKEVCESAFGGVLFIDEAYRLVPEHEGHSFGKDAINTLLKYMEDFRDQLVVIVAGYPTEMRRFMAANPGLASRFHFTLTFTSYTAGEIVEIGRHIAAKEKIAIAEDAWPLLSAEAGRLRSTAVDSGTALDVAGNGRYARKVIIACKRERARRLHTIAPAELASRAEADPTMLVVSADDMQRALASALG
ncbi:AAA family ATPase [Mycolicibacterium sp. P1-18]|uniref:AAA family ATPase n=1 Tax=Mycolicibacterium sp. P1-18 TaxID=2024615 RepID=UPI0011F20F8F|nr:AAA family ATPase [Mycolicibacterium sp. P1-18]KAA0093586.1 AAA family ATPase [Mycolicibacterium sp. P1-18]